MGRRGRRARRALHRIGVVAAIVVLLAVGAVVGLLGWTWASLPPVDGTQVVAGLRHEVQVERDARGRVTVRAEDRLDLAFGMGYAHAQDRFFQMDLLRRAGEGTLAALVGASAVRIDEGARRHDLAGTARAALARADSPHRALAQAYANGVNAGLADLGARPWEYILLRQRPHPWRAVDCLHVILAMYRDLQDETNAGERALDVARHALHPDVLSWILPERNPWEAPLAGEDDGAAVPWPAARVPVEGPGRDGLDGAGVPGNSDATTEAADEAMRGSNAWAVGGAFTADGRALLASDMHLGLSTPPIWTAMRLICTGDRPLDAVGVVLPGGPALTVGSNGHVAWGFTNSYGDWLDHVVIELDPDDPRRYRTPNGWRSLVSRRERIDVYGEAPRFLEIDQTQWGPIVAHDAQGRPLALHWVAQEDEGLDLDVIDLLDARSLDEALDIAAQSGIPHQNFVAASSTGEVAWTIAGRVPRRVGFDGSVPRSWADGTVGWDGWLGPTEVPRRRYDERGRVWSANARMVDPETQGVIGRGDYAVGARARRIRDLLLADDRFDEAGLLQVQLDTRAELMEQWFARLDRVVRAIDDGERREPIAAVLRDWNGHADPASVSYRLVREWRTELSRTVLDALGAPMRAVVDEDLVRELPRTEILVWSLLLMRPQWVPAPHANWDELERSALDSVLTRWGAPDSWPQRTWGASNRTTFAHPLSAALPPFLRRWIDLPARSVPGDAFVPRVSVRSHGASERMVVAPGAEERGILHLPGGPTAHPLSRWREGDLEEWAEGKPVPLRPGAPAHVRTLRPAEAPAPR